MLLNLLVPDMLLRKLKPPLTIQVRNGALLITLVIPIDFFLFSGGSQNALAVGDNFHD